jgi:hypothetical protein
MTTYRIERHYGAFIVRGGEYGEGEGTLVQTDWDWPIVARNLGWSMSDVQKNDVHCEHYRTDGTIDCPDCGVKAIEFICAAGKYLQERS